MPLSEKDKLLMSDKLSGADDETIQAALQELKESEAVPRGSSELRLPVAPHPSPYLEGVYPEKAPGVGSMLFEVREPGAPAMMGGPGHGVRRPEEKKWDALYSPEAQLILLKYERNIQSARENLEREKGTINQFHERINYLANQSEVQEWFGSGYKELTGPEVSDLYSAWYADQAASWRGRPLDNVLNIRDRDSFQRLLDSVLRHRHDIASKPHWRRSQLLWSSTGETETKKQKDKERDITLRLERLMGRE